MEFGRRITRGFNIGGVPVGARAAISIQSMTNTATVDVDATLRQISSLVVAGCDIVRVAVPDMDSADVLGEIVSRSPIPVVADIHFDYRLALKAIEQGVHKLRINPGNIGARWKVEEVVEAASDKGIPIRIGVNWGSVPKSLKDENPSDPAAVMIELAAREIEILNSLDFGDIVVSLKASSVPLTIETNRRFSERWDYPLHLGITEAGLPESGAVLSAVGIGTLLSEGIGDTVRVSLTGDPVREVFVARDILAALGLRCQGLRIVSCPTCARTHIDVEAYARQVGEKLAGIDVPITVAIMGCEVNGPQEAMEADIGIAGTSEGAVLFRNGKKIKRLRKNNIIDIFLTEIMGIIENRNATK